MSLIWRTALLVIFSNLLWKRFYGLKKLMDMKKIVANSECVTSRNFSCRMRARGVLLERTVLIMLLITSLFLLSISFAIGQVSIDNVDIPSSIEENNSLDMSFAVSTDTNSNMTYGIYRDGILVSNSTDYSVFMNYSSSGTYVFTFFVSDNESNITSDANSVDVIDIPLTLSITSPISKTYNSHSIHLALQVSPYADYCNYSINNSLSAAAVASGQLLNVGNSVDSSLDITLNSDGQYSLNVVCSNAFDTVKSSVPFSIDTINPVITSKSYSIDASNTVTIIASTDSVCVCKYDSSDISYDSMHSFFMTTNTLQHSTQISGLSDGSYNYYIRCKNTLGNIGSSQAVSFNIVTLPSASISLSRSSPIKAGTYKVRLATSKPVITAPTLYYAFDGDSTSRYITLTGSGSNWEGYMIIEDNTPNSIGTFHYSATDYSNNIGNKITGGEVFLVDTSKPPAPSSIEADAQYDGSIKLKWYYDGEEVYRYNIYRSTVGTPDYVDYYDSTTGTSYLDHDVIDGVIYYYTVAAIDDADNDGVLSGVMQATSSPNLGYSSGTDSSSNNNNNDNNNNDNVVHNSLDSGLAQKVDQLISELNNYLTDIDSMKSELNKINEPAKLKIISMMKLSTNMDDAKSKINDIITQSSALKNEDLKSSELDVRLNKLRMDAIKAESMVAEDIIVNEQSSYDQITQSSDVDNAITEAVKMNLSRSVLDNYSLSNKQMQDNIVVKTEAFIFKIKYLGKDDYDRYTLVKKVVSSSQDLREVSIIEVIPKSFETQASNLVFDIEGQDTPTILTEDPVLKWDLSTLNTKTIYYMTNSNAEMSSVKGTKTIVLYTPNFKVTQTVTGNETSNNTNGLTGLVGLDLSGIKTLSLMQWMVILGVGMILGLSTYYLVLDKKEKRRNVQRLREHRIISKPMQKNVPSNIVQIPRANIVPAARTVQKNVPEFDLGSMMDKSNDMINSLDYENSRNIYNACMKRFSTAKFRNDLQKKESDMMLNHIYIKLVAYRTIYTSRKHLAAKNYDASRSDLLMIAKIYDKLVVSLKHVDEDHKMAEEKYMKYIESSKKYVEKMVGQ